MHSSALPSRIRAADDRAADDRAADDRAAEVDESWLHSSSTVIVSSAARYSSGLYETRNGPGRPVWGRRGSVFGASDREEVGRPAEVEARRRCPISVMRS